MVEIRWSVRKSNIFLNFEERENSQFLDWQSVYDHIINKLSPNGTRYVFLDEIQILPQFEKLVDALFVKQNIDLYITGSNAFLLSSELGTLLSGRYIAINLHPFSFAEYVKVFGENASIDRLFRQYMNTSCFPEAVTLSLSSPDMVYAYLKALYETIVVKDIVKRHNLRKFDTLQHVVNFLFDSVGSIVSPNNIADVLRASGAERLSHNTVQKIYTFLHRVVPYIPYQTI